MNIAIIPARGGSKRIPRKNVKQFHGKPMIAWSIEAALNSGCFDKVIVSTDDDEIAQIARDHGALVPFIRPAELSNDYAGTIPVIAHAIEELQKTGDSIDLACCVYATAPFVAVEDIQHGAKLMESGIDYAFSATSFPYPIQRALSVTESGDVSMFEPEQFHIRSQDLPEAWHDAGQFYWGRASSWLQQIPIFTGRSKAVLIPRSRAQDIDTPEDWQHAELLFELLGRQ